MSRVVVRALADRPTILVLSSTYPRWGGDPEPGFVHELSKRLRKYFRMIVLCPHAPGAAAKDFLDGVHVVRYRYAPGRFESLVNNGGITANLRKSKWKFLLLPTFVLSQIWMAWRLTRKGRVDVIHAHWLLPQGLVAALLRVLPGRRTPFVVTSHGADLHVLRGRMMDIMKRFVLRRAESATVVSMAMRETLTAVCPNPGPVFVQPMGVDMLAKFVPDPTVIRSTREILFVGRLVEKKGVRHLIAAMPAIVASHPNARLTIAGFGPEESMLRRKVAELRLEARVKLIGAVPQSKLPALYQRAAVLVAPFVRAPSGDQEGLGLVLIEAIGCGCPVIAGDVPAVADVPVERIAVTSDSIAAAVRRVLDAPDESVEAAMKSRSYCLEKFEWDHVAAAYSRILGSALTSVR